MGTRSPRTLLARTHTAPIESVEPRPSDAVRTRVEYSFEGHAPSRDPQAAHYQHLITRGTEAPEKTRCVRAFWGVRKKG